MSGWLWEKNNLKNNPKKNTNETNSFAKNVEEKLRINPDHEFDKFPDNLNSLNLKAIKNEINEIQSEFQKDLLKQVRKDITNKIIDGFKNEHSFIEFDIPNYLTINNKIQIINEILCKFKLQYFCKKREYYVDVISPKIIGFNLKINNFVCLNIINHTELPTFRVNLF